MYEIGQFFLEFFSQIKSFLIANTENGTSFSNCFPGSGAGNGKCVSNCSPGSGAGNGKCYSVNVPLKEGMDDLSYELIFQPIMRQVRKFTDAKYLNFLHKICFRPT
jgi:hypothetical protein